MRSDAKMNGWTFVRMYAVSEWLRLLSLSLPLSLCFVWRCQCGVVYCGLDPDFHVVCGCGSDFVECRPISNLKIGCSLAVNNRSNTCDPAILTDSGYSCALSLFISES